MICRCTPEQLRNATRSAVLAAVLGQLNAAARAGDTYSLYGAEKIRPAAWWVDQARTQRDKATAEITAATLDGTEVHVDILLTVQPV